MEKPDSKPKTRSTFRRIKHLSRIFGVMVVLIGLLVLVGWLIDSEFLKRIWYISVAMNPVTAICLMVAGTALFMCQENTYWKHRKQIKWMAYFLIFIGTLKIASLLPLLDLPFDQILFKVQLTNSEKTGNNAMAPNTAFNFLLAGLALLFIEHETKNGHRPTQYISIVLTLLSLLSLYGHIYGITSLFSVQTHVPMAIHTSFAFLLLGTGILFARPDKGSMAIVIGENSGQIIFMRFIAFILPLFYGWLKLQGEHAGIYSSEYGTALFAILTYAVSMFFLARQSVLQHKIRKTRQLAHEAIRENERRLQAILDNTATPISLKTPLGKYTLVNRQFEKAFGLDGDGAVGKTDADLFPKEIAEELMMYDSEIIQQGEPKSLEEKYPHANGVHTYLTVKFPLFNQEQKIYALGAVSTDITKRKHLEEELRKSHQRLFGILDNLGEGVLVADEEGNFIIFNKRAEEILGLGPVNTTWQEWNKTFGMYMPDGETYFPAEEIPLYKAIQGEKADNVEMVVKNEAFPDGKWIAVTSRPVSLDQKKIIAGVAVFRDITLRKKLEQLFMENENRLKLILASIGEGVIILDKSEEVLLFNAKAEEILGAAPRNLPLEKWPEHYGLYQLDGETYLQPENLPFILALNGEVTPEMEIIVRNEKLPDGKPIYVKGRPILDAHNEITGAIFDIKDITEIRRLEDYVKEIQDQFYNLLLQQRPTL